MPELPGIAPELSADLMAYFTARDAQRQREIDSALPRLEADIEAFLAPHTGESVLPKLLALLIHEATSAAYVCGTMQTGGARVPIPVGRVILHAALETVRAQRDLYPCWALFDGVLDGEDEEDRDA